LNKEGEVMNITWNDVRTECEKNDIEITPEDGVRIAIALSNDIDFLNLIHEEIIAKAVELLDKKEVKPNGNNA